MTERRSLRIVGSGASPGGEAPGEVVSCESEELILVDHEDRELGHATKSDCHDGEGMLHRAFSVFVFDGEGQLLLQQRAEGKRLWPLYWSNSCCSHPRRGETMETAVDRRLRQELGIGCTLKFLFRFSYHARFGALGSEHELCSVFAGWSDDPVRANATEIHDCRLVSPDRLTRELEEHPERFTPWLRLEWPRVRALLPLRSPSRKAVND